ncbi:hypothetical protein ACKF11_13130 [Methylobacillus sp. Pita2]|uniref:hypothetical protein n=1 Tax=Methylobacillus sp. Pita2 TaxID=3383245 RepID=UPI0038B69DDB
MSSAKKSIYSVLAVTVIGAALYGAFSAGAKHTETNLKGQPAEIAQSYYDVINQAIKMEPEGGPIHEIVRLASADNKITYDEYGPIVEKIESFIDSQMNADRDRNLLTAKAELFMTVKHANNRLNNAAAAQNRQQIAYAQEAQPEPQQYQPEPMSYFEQPAQVHQPVQVAQPQQQVHPMAQPQYAPQQPQALVRQAQPQQMAQGQLRTVTQ